MAATWSWKESMDMSVISCSPSPFGRQRRRACSNASTEVVQRLRAGRTAPVMASHREIAQTVVPDAISQHEIDNGGVQAHPWSRTLFCRWLEG
jgi:hypothetical protein